MIEQVLDEVRTSSPTVELDVRNNNLNADRLYVRLVFAACAMWVTTTG